MSEQLLPVDKYSWDIEKVPGKGPIKTKARCIPCKKTISNTAHHQLNIHRLSKAHVKNTNQWVLEHVEYLSQWRILQNQINSIHNAKKSTGRREEIISNPDESEEMDVDIRSGYEQVEEEELSIHDNQHSLDDLSNFVAQNVTENIRPQQLSSPPSAPRPSGSQPSPTELLPQRRLSNLGSFQEVRKNNNKRNQDVAIVNFILANDIRQTPSLKAILEILEQPSDIQRLIEESLTAEKVKRIDTEYLNFVAVQFEMVEEQVYLLYLIRNAENYYYEYAWDSRISLENCQLPVDNAILANIDDAIKYINNNFGTTLRFVLVDKRLQTLDLKTKDVQIIVSPQSIVKHFLAYKLNASAPNSTVAEIGIRQNAITEFYTNIKQTLENMKGSTLSEAVKLAIDLIANIHYFGPNQKFTLKEKLLESMSELHIASVYLNPKIYDKLQNLNNVYPVLYENLEDKMERFIRKEQQRTAEFTSIGDYLERTRRFHTLNYATTPANKFWNDSIVRGFHPTFSRFAQSLTGMPYKNPEIDMGVVYRNFEHVTPNVTSKELYKILKIRDLLNKDCE